MESIKEILKKKQEGKLSVHAKHEFQDYGIRLSEVLHDQSHRSLYIKMSKEKPRALLEEAKVFATDYETKSVNRGRLFMWKLKQLENPQPEKSQEASEEKESP